MFQFYNSRVASLEDLEEVLVLEQAHLQKKYPQDQDKCRFLSWQAPWRKESLEHYFNLGWSFLLRSSSNRREKERDSRHRDKDKNQGQGQGQDKNQGQGQGQDKYQGQGQGQDKNQGQNKE